MILNLTTGDFSDMILAGRKPFFAVPVQLVK